MEISFEYGNAVQTSVQTAIAKLKCQHWDYPMDSQYSWFKENVGVDDVHVLMTQDDVLIGYLRITPRPLICSGASYVAGGIGTVITDQALRKQGLGKKLMAVANKTIEDRYDAGVLFTTKVISPFYIECGWEKQNALSVENSAGQKTPLGSEEICMTYDPQGLLKGEAILMGEKF